MKIPKPRNRKYDFAGMKHGDFITATGWPHARSIYNSGTTQGFPLSMREVELSKDKNGNRIKEVRVYLNEKKQ